MTDKNTLIGWFLRGMKPLAKQYEAWFNSYWHKSEKLPVSSVMELETILNNKSDSGHKHVIADTTDLQSALDGKADVDHQHDMTDVDGLQDKFSEEHLYFNNAINDEITQRKEADKAIQDEVDSLKRITMIRGNVDTYADLILLDTSTIREGDSYIVEADETREGKSTLYVWSGSWVYTGEWAGGGSGGSGENLANTDLTQTEGFRFYEVNPEKGWESELIFGSTLYGSKPRGLAIRTRANGTAIDVVLDVDSFGIKGIETEDSEFTVLTLGHANFGSLVKGRKLTLQNLTDVDLSDALGGDFLKLNNDGYWVAGRLDDSYFNIGHAVKFIVRDASELPHIYNGRRFGDLALVKGPSMASVFKYDGNNNWEYESDFTIEFKLLAGVDIDSRNMLSDGDVLTWNSTYGVWENTNFRQLIEIVLREHGLIDSFLDQRVASLEQQQSDLLNMVQRLEQMQQDFLDTVQRQEQNLVGLEQMISELSGRIDQLENRP